MGSRRSRGDGGLHWDTTRQRWIATVTTGYTPAGKRIVRKSSGKTRSEAKSKLRELVRDREDGLAVAPHGYTVAHAVEDWLQFGLPGTATSTLAKNTTLARTHVLPALGARRLRDLSAEEVDRWLAHKAETLSTSTLQNIRSILSRAIARAQARDKVKRNVVLLSATPTGRHGRTSKALTLLQAEALLAQAEAEPSSIGAYVVVSLLTGARTEELRALTWSDVDLAEDTATPTAAVPSIRVWRSVRPGGDTKTRKSRRTLALPQWCLAALRRHRTRQVAARQLAGPTWTDNNLVFASQVGTQLDAANVRRGFRRVAAAAGLVGRDWTPRELRHSFVSLLSDARVPIEQIARLVGHSGGTSVTERVYRHQISPVLDEGTTAMDRLFPTT